MLPKNLIKNIFTAVVLIGAAPVMAACAGGPNQESTGQYVDSSVITTKVKAKLAQDDILSIFKIHVTTYKDVVQLSGFVDSYKHKERAERLAASVDGVRSVRDNIEIKPKS